MPVSELLSHRAFARFWLTRVVGNAGSQMLMVAVAWQMYDLTASAWDLGLIGLLQFLPSIALVLVAGHVVDRHQRARVLALCLACQGVLATLLCAFSIHDLVRSEGLLLFSVALGVLRAFQMPAQQALTPCLVPTRLLPRALAFSSTGMQIAIIGGPALGGALYVAGAATTYAVCTAFFVAAAALCATIRYRHAPAVSGASLDSLLAGLRFVRDRKVVLGAVSLDLFAVLLGGATALLPIYAKGRARRGVVGAWAPALRARRRSGRHVARSCPLADPTPDRPPSPWGGSGLRPVDRRVRCVDFLCIVARDAGAEWRGRHGEQVIRQTLVQLETPDEMRGRVSAVNSVFIGASNQLGEFESGATAAWFGTVEAVVLGGIGTCVVALAWRYLFPELAKRDRLVAVAPPGRPLGALEPSRRSDRS